MAKKAKTIEAPAPSEINVQDKDSSIVAIQPKKIKRNLERFKEATGKSEAEYEKWATEVGRKMHIGTLDRLVCEKMGVYAISHLSLLPSEINEQNADSLDLNDTSAIIDITSNPYDLAKMWKDVSANAESWVCKESILGEKLGAFPKEDFERWGDKNCLSDVSKKWFDKEAVHLDVRVEILNADAVIEIQDVIDFVMKYKPNTYKNPMELLKERIEARFKEVTTFRIKDYYADHLIKACEYVGEEIIAPVLMAKIDVPKDAERRPLANFHKEISKLTYRHDTTDVFCDFVDLMLTTFKYHGDKELGDRLKAKYGKDYDMLCICVREMLLAYQTGTANDWYDGLGSYYEVITSSHKSSRLGQFFSPKPICDFMASITYTDTAIEEIDGKAIGKIVGDPCCGSGRMLLAFNKIAPGNYHYATDIDQVCVKMTAVNMCLHGICGQVVCADALWYGDSWRFGYQINERLKFGLPSIEMIEQVECLQSRISDKSFVRSKAEKAVKPPAKTEIIVPEFEVKVQGINVQLSLF